MSDPQFSTKNIARESVLSTNKVLRNTYALLSITLIFSALMAMYVNINWLWFTAFVGANLLQSSFTKWCLMSDILAKLGVKN